MAYSPTEQLHLIGALHANAGLYEGDDPGDIALRGAFDVSEQLSVGGYADLQQTYDSGTGESGDPIFERKVCRDCVRRVLYGRRPLPTPEDMDRDAEAKRHSRRRHRRMRH